MKAVFNPGINFTNTNLISEAARKMKDEEQLKETASRTEATDVPAISSQTNADAFQKELSDAELKEKSGLFVERLNSRKWKKEYLPENDVIIVREKHVKDGLEYMIKNDGTVMETGKDMKALTIIEPGRESAKTFAKYKKKLDPNTIKKSMWMRSKEIIADIWKFFSVAGTMTVATAKGVWHGALTGAAVLASATVVRGAIKVIKKEKTLKDIFTTNPLKTAGKTSKIISAVAGAVVLSGHLIAGRMKANQNSAVIEHKVDVPHYNN